MTTKPTPKWGLATEKGEIVEKFVTKICAKYMKSYYERMYIEKLKIVILGDNCNEPKKPQI